jgi:hypothetical protein
VPDESGGHSAIHSHSHESEQVVRAKLDNATTGQQIAIAIAIVAVLVLLAVFSTVIHISSGGAHKGITGGDPCAITSADEGVVSPQVCEEQKTIDQQRKRENAPAEAFDSAAGKAAENAAAAKGESTSAAGEAAENAAAEARENAKAGR